ncbi:MAG: hypothetical protein OEV42_17310 [Deltaproteobacteria bacterium]|nr:hypothetical protein [Deltaproteobacteria bacterium]
MAAGKNQFSQALAVNSLNRFFLIVNSYRHRRTSLPPPKLKGHMIIIIDPCQRRKIASLHHHRLSVKVKEGA